jgi:hypothetical protein
MAHEHILIVEDETITGMGIVRLSRRSAVGRSACSIV